MPKNQQPMTRNIPALLARTHFGQIIDRASQNKERFLVTKNGEAKAVILGIEDFLETVKALPQSVAELQEQATRGGAARLSLGEIEEEIAQVRKGRPKQRRVAQNTEEEVKGVKHINK
jgi:prevent-host-death family protein